MNYLNDPRTPEEYHEKDLELLLELTRLKPVINGHIARDIGSDRLEEYERIEDERRDFQELMQEVAGGEEAYKDLTRADRRERMDAVINDYALEHLEAGYTPYEALKRSYAKAAIEALIEETTPTELSEAYYTSRTVVVDELAEALREHMPTNEFDDLFIEVSEEGVVFLKELNHDDYVSFGFSIGEHGLSERVIQSTLVPIDPSAPRSVLNERSVIQDLEIAESQYVIHGINLAVLKRSLTSALRGALRRY